jgi:hypothetical protein
MKRSRNIRLKTLLATLLATAATIFAGAVASTTADDGIAPVSSSGSLLYAQQYLNRDKPPYVRSTRDSQQQDKKQLEKGEFARFEEKSTVPDEDRQPTYRHVPGGKPPYVRIH